MRQRRPCAAFSTLSGMMAGMQMTNGPRSARVSLLRLLSDSVKQALRAKGDRTIGHGVFGVPTLVVNKTLFWGADATDMAMP